MGLEIQKGDQIIFLVDRSGSMATADCNGDTRYNYVRETIKAFVRGAAQVDPDGVSVHLFNNRVELHEDVATPEAVDKLIDTHGPGGGTMTDLALAAAWKEHRRKGSKATFVVCFTDGEPYDRQAVEKEIILITTQMQNPEEFRVMFLTVGQRSPELAAWLEHIDSSLTGAKYDIIGHETAENVDFQQVIADLIGSSTTAGEAAAGDTKGKTTTHI
jgi:Mg-chelatase subunit ChlD